MIVTKTTGTVYPLTTTRPVTEGHDENPLVTLPKYIKDFRSFQTTFQFGVFKSQISPQTNWKR